MFNKVWDSLFGEDKEIIIKNKPNLIHNFTSSMEMLEKVKKLLKRARENMINHLKTLEEYDCANIKELEKTILSGIVKNGQDINIIIRPSDSSKIIIYYEYEKNLLKDINTELWYENGKIEPKQLTIGDILENTEINQIPIK